MESLLRDWDGEEVIIRFDRPTGSWIIIAIHSTRLGPASGGTRMKSYPDLPAALHDALRLSQGMTYKYAAVDFAYGGGKAVLAVPPALAPDDRDGLLRRYGTLIRDLGGLFTTGADVGTSPAEMDIIGETGGAYVLCRSTGTGDPGPETAIGVFEGIRTTCRHAFGDDSLTGRSFLVQGVGAVGGPLIERLHRAGARVRASDVDQTRTDELRRKLGVEIIPPDAVYDTPCDVFAPCALGGILNRDTIPRLRCRAVAGSANNQLDTPDDADRLRDRSILYAPDFVINSGGAVAIWGMERLGWSRSEAEARLVALITTTLDQTFALAEREGISTDAAARRIADARLSATHVSATVPSSL